MRKIGFKGWVLGGLLFAAGCSHSKPAPEPAQPAPQPAPAPAQPAPPPPQAQPAPMPPTTGTPMHGATNPQAQMPKGARVTQQQAEQAALAFAAVHGLPNAHVHHAEFRNGAWSVRLRGPGTQPGTENKMSTVVDNNGQVSSWALVPYGTPAWNQPD